MTEHTPGPWTVTVGEDDYGEYYIRPIPAGCDSWGYVEDECQANARLIAAAPALLEKVEEAVDLIPRMGESDPCAGALSIWCDETRALIEQVKGGAE